jgi:outer membrane protein assembly factor BamE (lipoprotein component of BamABCDE complex)
MVSDLLGNHLNDEMTRAEVRELLGPPDFAETCKGTKGCAYEIGNDDTDCSFVYVGFDKDGRLVKWFDSRSLTGRER